MDINKLYELDNKVQNYTFQIRCNLNTAEKLADVLTKYIENAPEDEDVELLSLLKVRDAFIKARKNYNKSEE